jgi:hypothetical protein
LNRPLALLFSIVGVLLMSSIGIALSFRILWLALLLTVASIGFVGIGFIVKAKMAKKKK